MNKLLFSAALACLLGTQAAAQDKTQQELQLEARSMTELTGYILQPSFENSASFGAVSPEWTNNGFQGQNNTAFAEKTGTFYCEKWIAAPNTIADAEIYQTVALPNGNYILSIDAKATLQSDETLPMTGVFLAAQNGGWDQATLNRVNIGGVKNFDNPNNTPCITYYLPVSVTTNSLTIAVVAEGATANYVRFDNVRIFTDNPIPVLANDIQSRINKLTNWLGELPKGYETMLYEGDVPLYDEAMDLSMSSSNVGELQSMVDLLDDLVAMAEKGRALHAMLMEGVLTTSSLASLTDYPGATAFSAAITTASDLFDDWEAMNEEFEAAIADLKSAIKTYKLSAAPQATEDNPLNVTFLIDAPHFTGQAGFEEPNVANQAAAERGLWQTNNVYTGAATEFRLSYAGGLNCWNMWSGSFRSLDLYQTLSGLPEGVYTVAVQASTNDLNSERGDVKGYARSTSGVVYSPAATIVTTASPFAANAQWEPLETGKIYVAADDTLRLGIRSTNSVGSGASNWFCATDFQLYYYGVGNPAKQVLEMKIAEALLLEVEGTMTNKALLELQTAIEAGQALIDNETFTGTAYEAALASLQNVIVLTAQRVANYADYLRIDNDINDFVNRAESEVCDLIAIIQDRYATQIDEAADPDELLAAFTLEMGQYLDFATVYQTYEAYYTNEAFELSTIQEYYAKVSAIIDYVAENGLTILPEAKSRLHLYLQTLLNANVNEGDVTDYLANPSFEENLGTSPIGWINSGMNVANNGNFVLNGEPAYTGANFIEQWVAGPNSLPNRHVYQTVYLPNGNYTVTAEANAFQQGNAGVVVTGYYLVAKNGEWTGTSDLMRQEITSPYVITAEDDTIVTYSITLDVTTGTLTFGVITDGTTANWSMADNFRLTLNRKFAVGIDELPADSDPAAAIRVEGRRILVPAGATIYTIQGLPVRSTDELSTGLYLVRIGNKTYKIAMP